VLADDYELIVVDDDSSDRTWELAEELTATYSKLRVIRRQTERGLSTAVPARSMLGQRALERPTVLVVNQHSLSDAEDFTEGYRALKLGKVVGEPTAGWIIYTSGTRLIDGSILRLPMIRVTTASGANMERNPRPVDIRVDAPLGEWYTGTDSQLDAAARELLREVGHAPMPSGAQ